MDLFWKQIPNFEGYYEVTNTGIVRSVDRVVGYRIKGMTRKMRGKILTPSLDGCGYYFVVLSKKGKHKTKKIHTLVLESFIRPPIIGEQCNHKNGIKIDNRIENLEWVSARENTNHSINVLGKKRNGIYHWNAKLNKLKINRIRKLYMSGEYTQEKLSSIFNIHRGQISKIVNYKSWA